MIKQKKQEISNIVFIGKLKSEENLVLTELILAHENSLDIKVFYCVKNEYGTVIKSVNFLGRVLKMTSKQIKFLLYNEIESNEIIVMDIENIKSVNILRNLSYAISRINSAKNNNELKSVSEEFSDFSDNEYFQDTIIQKFKEFKSEN